MIEPTKDPIKPEVFDQEYDKNVEKLASLIVKNLESSYSNEYEPFESYLKKVQLKFFKDIKSFGQKFKSGHQAILEEMKKK